MQQKKQKTKTNIYTLKIIHKSEFILFIYLTVANAVNTNQKEMVKKRNAKS